MKCLWLGLCLLVAAQAEEGFIDAPVARFW